MLKCVLVHTVLLLKKLIYWTSSCKHPHPFPSEQMLHRPWVDWAKLKGDVSEHYSGKGQLTSGAFDHTQVWFNLNSYKKINKQGRVNYGINLIFFLRLIIIWECVLSYKIECENLQIMMMLREMMMLMRPLTMLKKLCGWGWLWGYCTRCLKKPQMPFPYD